MARVSMDSGKKSSSGSAKGGGGSKDKIMLVAAVAVIVASVAWLAYSQGWFEHRTRGGAPAPAGDNSGGAAPGTNANPGETQGADDGSNPGNARRPPPPVGSQ